MRVFLLKIALKGFLCLLIATSCQTENSHSNYTNDTRSAENSMIGMKVGEGMAVELFASEPLLINPTNIDIDEEGRVWVCEGYNYRMNLNPGNPEDSEGDRIVILEDTDQDGKADSRKVFYQGTDINSALGICVLDNKVYVSRSPHVFLFEDTNGDDIADTKKIIFSGIGGEQHDHGVHAMTFGPDGRMYFNFGNAGQQLKDEEGNLIIDINGIPIKEGESHLRQGMVFRCDPDGKNVEVLAHNFRNNYEVAVDSYGSMWQSDNDDDGNKGTRINYVLAYGNYGYHDEMTGERWPAFRTGMHEAIPKRHWHLNDPGVVPNVLQTGAGSPTGMIVYEGRLLPERFWNQMIHCEPGKQVVRSYPVSKTGAGYTAEIDNVIWQEQDKWFRPSDVCVAPDGSLIVADWYDPGVGGHKMGDWEKGRLYRIAPPNTPYIMPKHDVESPGGAKDALKSPNQSVRYLAWKSLHEKGKEAEKELRNVWYPESIPHFRARALWLLADIPGKAEMYIREALNDEMEEMRILGLRIAKQLDPEHLLTYLKELSKDPSPQVRREVSVALRYQQGPIADEIWAELAVQYQGNDRWYVEALGIGSDVYPDERMGAYLQKVKAPLTHPGAEDIIWRVRAEKNLKYLPILVKKYASKEHTSQKFLRAFDFHQNPQKDLLILSLIQELHPSNPNIRNVAFSHLSSEFVLENAQVQSILQKALPSMKGSREYLNLIKKLNLKDQEEALVEMMLSHPDIDLRKEAANVILEIEREDVIRDKLNDKDDKVRQSVLMSLSFVGNNASVSLIKEQVLDKQASLERRSSAVRAMGQGWRGEHILMKMLEDGELEEVLEPIAAERLMSAIDGSLRKKAQNYLSISDEAAEAPAFAALIALNENPQNGQKVFERVCQSCHQVNGKGVKFGPDLSEIGRKLSEEAIYTSIIHPSSGINFGYEGYIIKMKDDNILSGYIESETEVDMTIRMPGGITQRIDKEAIIQIEMITESLMPGGLHLHMTKQELADLLAYLASLPGTDMVVQSNN